MQVNSFMISELESDCQGVQFGFLFFDKEHFVNIAIQLSTAFLQDGKLVT